MVGSTVEQAELALQWKANVPLWNIPRFARHAKTKLGLRGCRSRTRIAHSRRPRFPYVKQGFLPDFSSPNLVNEGQIERLSAENKISGLRSTKFPLVKIMKHLLEGKRCRNGTNRAPRLSTMVVPTNNYW